MKYRVKGLPRVQQAMQRARSMPLSVYVAQRAAGRTSGAFIPSEIEMGATADHIVYEEREPRITPTGILDHRGMMLLRVTVPIKEVIGFAKQLEIERQADEVETILPEDMLAVSDCGLGVGYLTPAEVEDEGETTPETIERVIRDALEECDGDVAAATKLLASRGIEVEFSVTEKGDA